MRVAILGGGLSGLAAAHRLSNETDFEICILEEKARTGGLAATIEEGGFKFDLGVHVLHMTSERASLLVEDFIGTRLYSKEFTARVFIKNRFHRYPPSLSGLSTLPRAVQARIYRDHYYSKILNKIFGRIRKLETNPKASFEEWQRATAGKTYYEVFFKDYSTKWWGLTPDKISADLIRYAYRSLFSMPKVTKSYPREGGIGQISDAFEKRLRDSGIQIRTETEITGLVVESGSGLRVESRLGSDTEKQERFDAVISTIPITETARMLDVDSRNLRYRSVIVVFLGFDSEIKMDVDWVHVVPSEFMTSRIHKTSLFNSSLVCDGTSALVAEIPCDFEDEIWSLTSSSIVNRLTEEVQKLNLIDETQAPIKQRVEKIRFSHPVYYLSYKQDREAVRQDIESLGPIITAGRQGEYVYSTMEHAIEMGMDAADKLLQRL